MKDFRMLILLGTLTLVITNDSIAQPFGDKGNRATGVVYKREIDKPFKRGEATVELFKKESYYDITNNDGLYYIVIPKDIEKYTRNELKELNLW